MGDNINKEVSVIHNLSVCKRNFFHFFFVTLPVENCFSDFKDRNDCVDVEFLGLQRKAGGFNQGQTVLHWCIGSNHCCYSGELKCFNFM